MSAHQLLIVIMRLKMKYLALAVFLCAAGVLVYHWRLTTPWMLDDSFISFRYAENLASGHGLVFNPGERVEGYTTFLWVVLLALGKWLGANTVLLSRILGTAFSLGCILLLLNARRFHASIRPESGLLAALFLGSCGVFTAWAPSGMEVDLFALAILWLVLFFLLLLESQAGIKKWLLWGGCAALTAMVRPEGMLVAGLLFLQLLVEWLIRKKRGFLPAALAFTALYAPYFLWRLFYYGYFFPNTFYAKVGVGAGQLARGWVYAQNFVSAVLPLAILFLLYFLLLPWLRELRRIFLLPLIFLVYTMYIIAVGGDVMPAFRFFAPVLPLLCLVAACALSSLAGSFRPGRLLLLLVAGVLVFFNLRELRGNRFIYQKIKLDKTAEIGREVGLWLKRQDIATAVLATNTAGSIPYYSGLRTIDMLGLNDVHIAHRRIPSLGQGIPGHEKGDGAYVLARKPDWIHLGGPRGSLRPDHGFRSDEEIFALPEFRRDYYLKTFTIPNGETIRLYRRRH
jgi:hypothetical protein